MVAKLELLKEVKNKMDEKKELQEGEKYINIKIDLGFLFKEIIKAISNRQEHLNLAVFKNDSEKPTAPLYKSKGIALWENTKKAKVKEELVN